VQGRATTASQWWSAAIFPHQFCVQATQYHKIQKTFSTVCDWQNFAAKLVRDVISRAIAEQDK